jgi:hypothetical protein
VTFSHSTTVTELKLVSCWLHLLNDRRIQINILMDPPYFSLLEMLSTGILSKLKSTYEAKDTQSDKVRPVYAVRFEAVLPLVRLLVMGIFLSMTSLLAECAVRRLLRKRPRDET